MTDRVIKVDLGYVPRAWQRECHKHKERFQVLVLHRRAGKTILAILKLINEALGRGSCGADMPLYVYMAPLLKQAKKIVWRRLKYYLRGIPGVEINESDLSCLLPNGAMIQLYGGNDPDGLRGVGLDGCVMDEVAQMDPAIWEEIIQPALADRKGWALFIGTPKGVNLFSELYYKALQEKDWWAARYTVYDTDALDPDEVARLRRDMPDNEFNREFLCDFTASAENQLISIAMTEEAARRNYHEAEYSFAARILGVDVARYGDDRSVILARQGVVAFPPKIYSGLSNMEFADRVATAIVAWRPNAVFIDAGMGGGVIDRLRQLGHDVIEVNFGGKSSNPKYHDKRTEMYYMGAEWLREGGAIPNDPIFKMELATPTYDYDLQGKIKLESKDDIKERLPRSPDIADAWALTFAFPVAPPMTDPREVRLMNTTPNMSIHEYNPMEGF